MTDVFHGFEVANGEIVPEGMSNDELLTSKQVAALLGVTPGRIRQLTQTTGIGTKIGDVWIFRSADVEALRKRRTIADRSDDAVKQDVTS